MTTQQPEALRLAEILEGDYCPDWLYERGVDEVSAELRRQHARITELEAQLAQRFDAADMATAAAQGFRDGVASLTAQAADSVQEDAARLLALDAEANQIFNDPPSETSQDVRDVIEWFSGSIRVVLDAARKQGASHDR